MNAQLIVQVYCFNFLLFFFQSIHFIQYCHSVMVDLEQSVELVGFTKNLNFMPNRGVACMEWV